jgi:hypothetical protein
MLTNSVNCPVGIFSNDIKQKMIRNNQLLLSLIPSLLLIGVGLIGFGKKTGLSTM